MPLGLDRGPGNLPCALADAPHRRRNFAAASGCACESDPPTRRRRVTAEPDPRRHKPGAPMATIERRSDALAGKVAIVTGSSSGIGAGIARHFAAHGAGIVVNSATSVEAGEAVAAELPDAVYVQASI